MHETEHTESRGRKSKKKENALAVDELFDRCATESNIARLNASMTSEDLNFDVCEWCAKKFKPTRTDRRYCSRRCATLSYHHLTKLDLVSKRAGLHCESCGSHIPDPKRSHRRFCDKCANQREMASKRAYALGSFKRLAAARAETWAALKCQMCGTQIPGARRADRKFCDACIVKRDLARPPRRGRPRLPIPESCQMCGGPIPDALGPNRRFCDACRRARARPARRKRVESVQGG